MPLEIIEVCTLNFNILTMIYGRTYKKLDSKSCLVGVLCSKTFGGTAV